MKKLALLLGAAVVVAPAAFAGPDKKAPKEPTEVKCAVMTDHKVNIKDATAKHMYSDFKGNRYFFCCGGCPGQFKASPEKFAKNDHIKAPKEGKKKA